MRLSKPTSRKFTYDRDPDGAWIKIRALLPGERTDILDNVFTQEIEYRPGEDGKPGNPVFKQTTDKKKDREKTFVARVEDWGKFFEEDGKTPMECTPENIIRAMREIEGFTEATNKFFEQLDEDLAKERAESLGN